MCGGGGGGGGGTGLDSVTFKFPRRNAEDGASADPDPEARTPSKDLVGRATSTPAAPSLAAGTQASRSPAAGGVGSSASPASTVLTGAGGVPRSKHTLGKATVLGS